MPSPALLVAGKDLRRRIRDRTAILVAIVLPLALAWVFSLTLGGVDEAGFDARFAVVDLDRSDVSRALAGTVTGLDFVETVDADDLGDVERLADDGDVDAGFVIPAGFGADVAAGRGGQLLVVRSPDSTVGALVAESIARSYAARLDAVGVAVSAAAHAGGTPEAELPALAERARAIEPAVAIGEASAEDRVFSATTFFAIGMAVFFLFFAVEFGVRGLLEERADGTLARLLVAPVPPRSVLGGKALASFGVGLVSTSALVLASTWLLDATWGAPLGVALLVVTGVGTAVAVTALVSTFARTPAQAGNYASIVAVVGGLLGGTFFPISQAPGALAAVRFLAPQGWLMDGFQTLASGGAVAEALPAVAGTVAIGLVCGAAAWVRAERLMGR
ncbi:MAG TPA: ABC transporter permease [Actinomycetota bacterium]